MLVIRNEQMKEIRRAVFRNFMRRLALHIAASVGGAPADSFHDLSAAVDQARDLGIVRENDVAEFCELVYTSSGSLDFRKLPRRAQSILMAYREDPRVKLERLRSWLKTRPQSESARA